MCGLPARRMGHIVHVPNHALEAKGNEEVVNGK